MTIPNKFKNVFITGGAGFIGSHLTDLLVGDGKNVVVYDNLSSGKKEFLKNVLNKKNFSLKVGDLLDTKSLSRSLKSNTDIVFHLAANPDISKGIEDPTLDFNQTIVATFNLLQEMRKKKIKHLVYFSGSGVYGDLGNKSIKESYGPPLPVSMYGASKLSAEGLISAFSNLFDIQVWIFRPANIIGGRATHGVIFDFVNKLKHNPKKLVILGDGKQSKSYVYIADVMDAISIALNKSNKKINLFNISSKSSITVNEIASYVFNAMNLKNVQTQHTKGNIGWPGDVPVVRIDSSRLKNLGWVEKYNSKMAVQQALIDILSYE